MSFRWHVAMGDPQAPLATVLDVLDGHGLLRAGRLRPDVQLVSIGDHFDWGQPHQRRKATDDATALLAWLASHPPDQVVILVGNHDLARVCELWPFERDEDFEAAHAGAAALYRSPRRDAQAEAAYLAANPRVPTVELLARDYSAFSTAQQREVIEFLRTKRFRFAHAHRGLLLVHAGVTADDFALIGQPPPDAESAAANLNAFFDARVDTWDERRAFDLTPLHRPGSASQGEGRGVLYQRPMKPVEGDERFVGPPRRRYDPRALPAAFPQAIGHVRDDKCRKELGDWADAAAPRDGVLRSLVIDGDQVRYAHGTQADARLYFLDGGMNHVERGARYELLDLDRRAALELR